MVWKTKLDTMDAVGNLLVKVWRGLWLLVVVLLFLSTHPPAFLVALGVRDRVQERFATGYGTRVGGGGGSSAPPKNMGTRVASAGQSSGWIFVVEAEAGAQVAAAFLEARDSMGDRWRAN